ncbi:MAG TPA: RNase adapter RapZ [Acetobacteraceae bacterium]|nr:RNase adapter RapZ [Acetobacteraceae bacterium]
MSGAGRRVVIVTGLSGAGKASVLRALEDIGFEAVDNPPLPLVADMVRGAQRSLALGVDARSTGFDAAVVVEALERLRADPELRAELIYCWAEQTVLLRRFSETRRRHPLAPSGRVSTGISKEQELTERLREVADLVLDTSDLPLAEMRAIIERRYGDGGAAGTPRMAMTLVSFSYAHGLPAEADLVFDARFLRNPHYDPILRPRTGLDPEVAAYVEADRDFAPFMQAVQNLLDLVLPRFVQEGKKYATIAVGCTGGRHRSVHVVEKLAAHLARGDESSYQPVSWLVQITHRELARQEARGR